MNIYRVCVCARARVNTDPPHTHTHVMLEPLKMLETPPSLYSPFTSSLYPEEHVRFESMCGAVYRSQLSRTPFSFFSPFFLFPLPQKRNAYDITDYVHVGCIPDSRVRPTSFTFFLD